MWRKHISSKLMSYVIVQLKIRSLNRDLREFDLEA